MTETAWAALWIALGVLVVGCVWEAIALPLASFLWRLYASTMTVGMGQEMRARAIEERMSHLEARIDRLREEGHPPKAIAILLLGDIFRSVPSDISALTGRLTSKATAFVQAYPRFTVLVVGCFGFLFVSYGLVSRMAPEFRLHYLAVLGVATLLLTVDALWLWLGLHRILRDLPRAELLMNEVLAESKLRSDPEALTAMWPKVREVERFLNAHRARTRSRLYRAHAWLLSKPGIDQRS